VRDIELTDNIYRLCFAWMKKYKVTFYDAAYLAIAYDIQATLVTADEKFVKKMEKIDCLCLLRNIDL
jgi:predicted nucleic acid-binding protein